MYVPCGPPILMYKGSRQACRGTCDRPTMARIKPETEGTFPFFKWTTKQEKAGFPFSNFAAYDVVLNGTTYATGEAAYQASKYAKDPKVQEMFAQLDETMPGFAQKLGKSGWIDNKVRKPNFGMVTFEGLPQTKQRITDMNSSGDQQDATDISKLLLAEATKKAYELHNAYPRRVADEDALDRYNSILTMAKIVGSKCERHQAIREILKATILENGTKLRIQEASPFDSFWGIGREKNGANFLGRLWELQRENLEVPLCDTTPEVVALAGQARNYIPPPPKLRKPKPQKLKARELDIVQPAPERPKPKVHKLDSVHVQPAPERPKPKVHKLDSVQPIPERPKPESSKRKRTDSPDGNDPKKPRRGECSCGLGFAGCPGEMARGERIEVCDHNTG
jgi:predicted NAD-dependent protein-ADP-ribosyltransferase YbiA (DUF1768 family)